jgi:hypothetical protein
MEKFCTKSQLVFAKSHTGRFARPDHQTVAEAAHTYAAAQAPPPHSSNTWPSRNLPTRTDGKNGKFISQTQPQSEGIYLFYQQK